MKRNLFIMLFLLASICMYAEGDGANRGYRGNVTANFLFGNDGVYSKLNDLGGGVLTTHGYQFNPHIFVGGGVGVQVHAMSNFETAVCVPAFAAFRANFKDSKVSPYFEAKVGYSTGQIDGPFLSPGFGLRIGLVKNLALNLSLTYTAQGYVYEDYKRDHTAFDHTCNFGIGIEF